ncbi:MAG: PIN domain-containing protein [Nanoarchaeota archaeon]
MNKFVIDTYAWIEYFNGTIMGNKVKDIVENTDNNIYTNVISVAELASSYKRNSLSFDNEKESLILLSNIFLIDFDFAQEAGILHATLKKDRKHISMADIFILLTAKKLNAHVVTGDQDFKGLKDVILLK